MLVRLLRRCANSIATTGPDSSSPLFSLIAELRATPLSLLARPQEHKQVMGSGGTVAPDLAAERPAAEPVPVLDDNSEDLPEQAKM